MYKPNAQNISMVLEVDIAVTIIALSDFRKYHFLHLRSG